MLKLVSKYNDMYAVYDDSDDETDVITESELKLLLNVGVSVDGATRVDDNNFSICDNIQTLSDSDVKSEEEVFDDFDMAFDDGYSDEDESEEDYEDELEEEYDEYSDYDDESDEEVDYDDISYEDFYDDDDEESMLEESIVNKLYNILTPDQLNALRKYYLWYSRRLFANATHDTTFGMTNKKRIQIKKQALDGLKNKNSNAVWKYAGFIDMGRKGDGFCELGHPLRYMHIAWDTSVQDIDKAFFGEDYEGKFDEAIESENSIVFGIKCIADFFEVDKELISQLQSAQRESLKDMALIYEFHERGISDKVIESFSVLDEFMKLFKISLAKAKLAGTYKDEDFSQALINFYMEFRKLNMVPPKSMIQEIRDKLIGWETHKFSGDLKYLNLDVFCKNFSLVFNNSADGVINLLNESIFARGRFLSKPFSRNFNDSLYLYFLNYFGYKLCGHYEWGTPRYTFDELSKFKLRRLDKNDVWSDEGGWSNKIKDIHEKFNESINNYFFIDPEYNINYIRKIIECVNLATKYSYRDDRFCTNYIIQNDDGFYSLSDDVDYKDYIIKLYCDSTYSNLFDSIDKLHSKPIYAGFGGFYNNNVTIDVRLKELKDLVSYIDEELPKFLEWVDSNLGRIVDEKNRERRELLDKKAKEEEQKRLEEEERKKKEEEEAKKREEEERLANESKSDRDKVLDYLKNADITSIEHDEKFSFHLKVLSTLKKYGKASDKQYIYLKDIYDVLNGKTDINTDHRTEKKKLSDNPDLKEALEWYVSLTADFDKKTQDISNSVLKYGTISDKQMKYMKKVKELYDKSKG